MPINSDVLKASVKTMDSAFRTMIEMYQGSMGEQTHLSESRWAMDPLDVIADIADVLRAARNTIAEERLK